MKEPNRAKSAVVSTKIELLPVVIIDILSPESELFGHEANWIGREF
jgi:hypothetical protein